MKQDRKTYFIFLIYKYLIRFIHYQIGSVLYNVLSVQVNNQLMYMCINFIDLHGKKYL